jgi:2-methylcitrate dehydratase PrpD
MADASRTRQDSALRDGTAAQKLSAHFTSLRFSDIPPAHILGVKRLIRDYLGVALGGSRTDSAQIAARFAVEIGGKAEAAILGSGSRVPAVHAAFANAIASHSIELDDVDVLALFHFSPPVVSAALATAEREGASGEEFLVAVVAGCEMMARASNATNYSLRDRGFHTTPACGVFGAAITAARLMKLDESQTTSALGLAGAQAGGLMEMYGPSMQKRFNPGPAARDGVTAALMARLGYTGTASIFDGERGFCRTFSDSHDVAELWKELGENIPIAFEFKPYSCARPIHNAIDCALEIRRKLSEPLAGVGSITVRRHPRWANYHGNAKPRTYHEAQVSLPYSVAVALAEGAALPAQYRDEKLSDPELLRLASLVEVVPDETLPRGVSCAMTVGSHSGLVLHAQVDHPRGSVDNPMSEDEMRHKVHMLADPVLGVDNVERMIEAIEALETASSLEKLMASVARVPA